MSDSIRAILLDIEGTTTPVDFVYGMLFPFARARIRNFAASAIDLARLHDEFLADSANQQSTIENHQFDAVSYLEALMDQDRKSTALKSIQGKIWEEGYRSGELHGEVYPDVPPAFERWTSRGIKLSIFSSGSVLAQKLIFGSTEYGDLTKYLSGYFDTETGPKRDPSSYSKIAEAMGFAPAEVLFLSDVLEELIAATESGMEAMLVVRPGNKPVLNYEGERAADFEHL